MYAHFAYGIRTYRFKTELIRIVSQKNRFVSKTTGIITVVFEMEFFK